MPRSAPRSTRGMIHAWLPLACAAALLGPAPAQAAEPDNCRTVRFSDVGWTDITSTTAAASVVLEGLGYEPEVEILAVPVTYASMKNQDIDVFLGNWMPTMEGDVRPYLDDGSVESIRANLEGAKYTLAVPTYLADEGLKDFADIAEFQRPAGRADLRHRAGQRRQPPDPGDDRGGCVRPEGLRAGRELRAGHARPGRARDPRRGSDRVPRLGAASDEREFRAHLSLGRRRCVRPELRWRHGPHQRARRAPAGVPQSRQSVEQPRLLAADGERDHGRDPERRRGSRTRPPRPG